MFDIDEKLMSFLTLSDEDKENLAAGNVADVFQNNRDAFIRYISVCGGFFCSVFIFLMIFTSSGYLLQPVVFLLFAAFLAGVFFIFGKDTVLTATRYKGVVLPLTATFGCSFLYMFQDVLSGGGFFSFLLILASVGGVGYAGYKQYLNDPEKWTLFQLITAGLLALTMFFCVLYIGQTFTDQKTRDAIIESANEKRNREAREMRKNMQSCTSEEECARMRKNKNAYFDAFSADAHNACEYAVADAVPSRFEWTNPAGTQKFQSYSIDTLKETITLMGTTASMIDMNGAKTPFGYSCVYNTRTKATAVRLQK